MVIQVLIAQITLSNQDEFGIELGLQDSILFDRSLLGNLLTTTTTSQTSTPSGIVTQTQQNIVALRTSPVTTLTISHWATAAARRRWPIRTRWAAKA